MPFSSPFLVISHLDLISRFNLSSGSIGILAKLTISLMNCHNSQSVRPALALWWCVVTGLEASSRLKWECSVWHWTAFPISLMEGQQWFIDKQIYPLVMQGDLGVPRGSIELLRFRWCKVFEHARGHSAGGSQGCFVLCHCPDSQKFYFSPSADHELHPVGCRSVTL